MASSIVTPVAVAPRRVALVVETSKAFGRGVLRGISRWQREREPWRVFADERGFNEPVPDDMLTAAWDALQAGAFDRVEDLLDGVNGVLEGRTFSGSLAADYLAVVQAVAVDGLEVQYIELDGTRAHVWAVADWPDLTKLTLKRTGSGWALVD